MQNKNIFLGTVFLVFFLLVGIIIGVIISKSVLSPAFLSGGKEQAIQDLRQKLNSKAEKGLISFGAIRGNQETNPLLTSVIGEITKIDAKTNTVQIKIANKYDGGDLFSYLDEPDYNIKTVKINTDTKIIKRENLSADEQKKAAEDYLKMKEANGGRPISIGAMMKDVILTINDLKIGTKVSIETLNQFSSKDNKEINAKKIVVIL